MIELKAIRDKYDPHGGRAIGSREMLDISEDYYPKFRQVLTARQVLNLYRFERSKFDKARDELHRRGDKGRPGAGGPRRGGDRPQMPPMD